VRGAKLEDVLDSAPGLTPGDFVRSVKQLIDLLDQIAAAAGYDANGKPSRARARAAAADDSAGSTSAPPEDAEAGQAPRRREPAPRDRDVAATARAAIDAMRRGVIAYTTLTD
jgi:ATP-dependent RNA helicase HelY